MQIIRRVMIAFGFLSIFLAGCSDDILKADNLKLVSENAVLRRSLDVRIDQIDYFENQASISRGCDFLIPVCPQFITKAGEKAIKNGYGGASGLWFWAAFILKIAGISAAAMTAWWFYQQLILPTKQKIEEAEKTVNEARMTAAAMVDEARGRLLIFEKKTSIEKDLLADLIVQTTSAKAELVGLENDLVESKKSMEMVRAARAALDNAF